MKNETKFEMIDENTLSGTINWTLTKDQVKFCYLGNDENLTDEDFIKWGKFVNLYFGAQIQPCCQEVTNNFTELCQSNLDLEDTTIEPLG